MYRVAKNLVTLILIFCYSTVGGDRYFVVKKKNCELCTVLSNRSLKMFANELTRLHLFFFLFRFPTYETNVQFASTNIVRGRYTRSYGNRGQFTTVFCAIKCLDLSRIPAGKLHETSYRCVRATVFRENRGATVFLASCSLFTPRLEELFAKKRERTPELYEAR